MTRRTRADALLSELPEFNVGLALSDAISARLDALVDLANAAGTRTSRKELIAALLLATGPNDEELAETVRRYRTARARDTLFDNSAAATMLTFTPRKPGPRGRRTVARAKTT
jgi:hypothetical protein